ncbi:MAG TPA: adenylate/guanylate cyclase domain-containing protein [Acidimicrobiales bacterium]|nr:adenylate/guanylate cyclase domain-containing protein [Acidimicrobiales bacterium]
MALPSGSVTFCFTDIEGSTKLFARLGDAYLGLIETHRHLIRTTFGARGGVEVKSEGDGFFFAFPTAAGAVEATVSAQLALRIFVSGDDRAVRVRMGLHTATAEPVGDDYIAFAVHEAARVAATAHGGQIVVSQTTRADAVVDDERIGFEDLGAHDLRDLPSPMRLFQVTHPELQAAFPPLRTTPTRRDNLPVLLSSFVRRDEELSTVVNLVAAHRLVTITGAGGAGKTRLALEAARGAASARPDGVWFVDLSAVRDESAVADAAVTALGVAREPNQPALDQLRDFARARAMLVVLDNCEHVLGAATDVALSLLDQSSSASVLATSREPLGVLGEVVWRLDSMSAEQGRELFIRRAEQAGAALPRDEASDAAIAQICRRLDGIPLAIELAAARATVLRPDQIAERLDDRFRLLTGGARTVLGRQRTLEAALDWSHDLLDEDDRALLRRLSVFAGTFDLAGAEAVCGRDVLDGLARLAAKSLIVVVPARDHLRYRLLDTIRSYGWNKLVVSGEDSEYRGRHLAHHVDVAHATAPGLFDDRECAAVDVLREANDNFRAALDWAISSGDAVSAHHLAGHLWLFWSLTGSVPEGSAWVHRVLDMNSDVDVDLRALVASGAAHLWQLSRSHTEVAELASSVVARMLERGGRPRWYEVWAAMLSGGVTNSGVYFVTDLALDAARRCANPSVLATVLVERAQELRSRGRLEEALLTVEQAELEARRSGSIALVAYTLCRKSAMVAEAGERFGAVGIARDAVAAARRGPNVYFLMYALETLGLCCAEVEDSEAATAAYAELLHVAMECGAALPAARASLELSALAAGNGEFEEARRLLRDARSALAGIAAHDPPAFLLMAMAGHARGEICLLEGDHAGARRVFEASAAAADGLGIAWVKAFAQNSLGWLALAEGNFDAAEAHQLAAASAILEAPSADEAFLQRQALAASSRGRAAVAFARNDEAAGWELVNSAADYLDLSDASPRVATILFRRVMSNHTRAPVHMPEAAR